MRKENEISKKRHAIVEELFVNIVKMVYIGKIYQQDC
jgi:hypothetical protein